MKKIIIALIFLGVIGLGINAVFGWNTFTYITPFQIQTGQTLYKLNLWNYIENLRNSFGTITTLTIETPTRVWTTGEWDSLANDLALMLDWFLFGINILLYQFRIGGYVILQLLAIIGINTITPYQAGGLQWLVDVSKFLRDLQIAYI